MIEPDFSAMDREITRPEREKDLINQVHKLKYVRKQYALATIKAEEAIAEAHMRKDEVDAQEEHVKKLMENL